MKVTREALKVLGFIALGLACSVFLDWIGRYGLVRIRDHYYSYLIVFICWLVIVFPAGELIGHFLRNWEPIGSERPGLEKAGKLIGQIERTVILIFYLAGSLEGIAFLVVAKSIYRFGDLTRGYRGGEDGNDERGTTFSISEYIILGSLLSYGVGLVGGVIIHLLLSNLGLPLHIAP